MPNKTSFFSPCVSNPFLSTGFDKNSVDFGLDVEVGERSYGGWGGEEKKLA